MREEMRKANLKDTEFEMLRGTFKVTFWKENNRIDANNCVDNDLKILELLKQNPVITQLQIANELNISKRTVSTLLAGLKKANKIKRIGSNKNSYSLKT